MNSNQEFIVIKYIKCYLPQKIYLQYNSVSIDKKIKEKKRKEKKNNNQKLKEKKMK